MIISNLSSDNLIALVLDLTQSLKINIAAVVAIPVLCIVLTTVVIIFALVVVIVVVRYEIHIMCTVLLIITYTLIAWLVIFKARWQSNARFAVLHKKHLQRMYYYVGMLLFKHMYTM